MDLFSYFKDKIMEELADAREYIVTAFNLKPMSQAWAKSYVDMATAELTHAAKLYKMFDEYWQTVSKSVAEMPEYMSDIRSEVIDGYTKKYTEAKELIDLYD